MGFFKKSAEELQLEEQVNSSKLFSGGEGLTQISSSSGEQTGNKVANDPVNASPSVPSSKHIAVKIVSIVVLYVVFNLFSSFIPDMIGIIIFFGFWLFIAFVIWTIIKSIRHIDKSSPIKTKFISLAVALVVTVIIVVILYAWAIACLGKC